MRRRRLKHLATNPLSGRERRQLDKLVLALNFGAMLQTEGLFGEGEQALHSGYPSHLSEYHVSVMFDQSSNGCVCVCVSFLAASMGDQCDMYELVWQ